MLNSIMISKQLDKVQRRLNAIKKETEIDAVKEDIKLIQKIIRTDIGHCMCTLKIRAISSEKMKEYCEEINDILETIQENYEETDIKTLKKLDQCIFLIECIEMEC